MGRVWRWLGWGATRGRGPVAMGAGITLLLACITVADHIDFALEIAEAGASTPLPHAAWWWGSAVAGTVVGFVVVRMVLVAACGGACQARHRRLHVLAWLALLCWIAWLWLNVVARHADSHAGVGWPYQLAVVLEIGAFAALVAVPPDDAMTGIKQARAVRAQLLVLGSLAAAVFIVPFSAAQVEEVLRAWTDGHFVTAVSGLALALLLGAVVRASTIRLANPPDRADLERRWQQPWRRRAYAGGALVALVVWLTAGAWLGVIVVVAVALITVGTKWAAPLQGGEELSDDDVHLTRGLGGALAAVPAAILFVSLVAATIDSYFLPGAERALPALLVTVATGLVLVALIASAPAEPPAAALKAPTKRSARPLIELAGLGVLCAAAAFVAGYGPARVAGDAEAAWALGLLALAGLVALRTPGRRGAPELVCGWAVVIGVTAAVYAEPVSASRAYGSFALALTGAVAVMLVLHAVGSIGAAREPRARFAVLPARVPVIGLLGAWLVLAAVMSHDTIHQARTTAAAGERTPLDDAVRTWLEREAAGASGPVSMVLVGASGGGAKAAFWTTLVMDCVLGKDAPVYAQTKTERAVARRDPALGKRDECAASGSEAERLGHVFLTSSVSGGSVGVFHLLRHLRELRAGTNWVRDSAGPEVLSPVAGWGLLHDLPAWLVGLPADPTRCGHGDSCRRHADRALVQELAVAGVTHGWENDGMAATLLEPRAEAPWPVFNATLNGGGNRAVLSPLNLAPRRPLSPDCPAAPAPEQPLSAAFDSADVTGTADVPLVTASLLSARFPGIAPAGRLGGGEDDRAPNAPDRCSSGNLHAPVELRDGGYVENTGLLTIVELVPRIRAVIAAWNKARAEPVDVPLVVVSIDDDAIELDDDPRLTKQGRNWLGISQTAGPGYLTRSARDKLTAGQLGDDVSYVRISPPPHPGARATTGWEVSPTARRHDLGAALRGPLQRCLVLVRALLDGTGAPGPTCPGAVLARPPR